MLIAAIACSLEEEEGEEGFPGGHASANVSGE